MIFSGAAERLLNEWHTMSEAPILFALTVLAASAIIWWVLRWRYKAIISNKDSEISLYETKLKVGTPEEAVKKFESLQNEIAELKKRHWRALTLSEIDQLADQLRNFGPARITTYADEAASSLVNSFEDAFKKAKWIVDRRNSIIPLNNGITVYPKNDLAEKLLNAIRSATSFVAKLDSHGGITDVDVVLSIGQTEH